MIFVVFGPPASGKGTQAERLSARFGYPHISTGDILRMEQETGSALGQRVTPIMAAGDLVPDDIVTEVVARRLSQPDAARGAVLDGVPRTAGQARALDALLERRGCAVDMVLTLSVPEVELRERAHHRGEIDHRVDDREAAFLHRLEKYEAARGSLIDHYAARGTPTEEIDGVGTVDEVEARIAELVAGVPFGSGT